MYSMADNVKDLVAATIQVENNVDDFSDGFNNYLGMLGLPTNNLLIDKDERLVVINNLPSVVKKLDDEKKKEAMYISKFIAACGAGLFDAALNFLWNETIVNLRKKIIRFDLDYFLDSIINDSKRRASLKNEEDLKKIDDWELIKGCKDTGIITDIGYKHLDYIREMRNYASAAHPNQNNIDGLQISSWLQTCIKEVLAKEPEGPVIEIRKLIYNVRNKTLSADDTPIMINNIGKLPIELIDSLLRALYGMYCTDNLAVNVKNNVILIGPEVWKNCSKEAKCECGLKYAVFAANGDVERKNSAHEFLDLVNGLSYIPNDQKVAEILHEVEELYNAHCGYNNFYNEPVYARELVKYIPDTGEVPSILERKYIKVVILCRIGNGYGVSQGAVEYYDKMISLFSEKQFIICAELLKDSDIQSALRNNLCINEYKRILSNFKTKCINLNIKGLIEFILDSDDRNLCKLYEDKKYQELIKKVTNE